MRLALGPPPTPPGLAYICEGLKEQRKGLVTLVLWNNQLTHTGMAFLGMTLVSGTGAAAGGKGGSCHQHPTPSPQHSRLPTSTPSALLVCRFQNTLSLLSAHVAFPSTPAPSFP